MIRVERVSGGVELVGGVVSAPHLEHDGANGGNDAGRGDRNGLGAEVKTVLLDGVDLDNGLGGHGDVHDFSFHWEGCSLYGV